jgi:hypothetical protein
MYINSLKRRLKLYQDLDCDIDDIKELELLIEEEIALYMKNDIEESYYTYR